MEAVTINIAFPSTALMSSVVLSTISPHCLPRLLHPFSTFVTNPDLALLRSVLPLLSNCLVPCYKTRKSAEDISVYVCSLLGYLRRLMKPYFDSPRCLCRYLPVDQPLKWPASPQLNCDLTRYRVSLDARSVTHSCDGHLAITILSICLLKRCLCALHHFRPFPFYYFTSFPLYSSHACLSRSL